MARMHSRKHGKHGSTKPPKRRHVWLIYDKEEIEQLIKKLAKEGKSNSDIKPSEIAMTMAVARIPANGCLRLSTLILRFLGRDHSTRQGNMGSER